MRRRIQITTTSTNNPASDVWIQHLLARILLQELDLPDKLQAKILYELYKNKERIK